MSLVCYWKLRGLQVSNCRPHHRRYSPVNDHEGGKMSWGKELWVRSNKRHSSSVRHRPFDHFCLGSVMGPKESLVLHPSFKTSFAKKFVVMSLMMNHALRNFHLQLIYFFVRGCLKHLLRHTYFFKFQSIILEIATWGCSSYASSISHSLAKHSVVFLWDFKWVKI